MQPPSTPCSRGLAATSTTACCPSCQVALALDGEVVRPRGLRRRRRRHPLHDLLGHEALRGVGDLAAPRRGRCSTRDSRVADVIPAFGIARQGRHHPRPRPAAHGRLPAGAARAAPLGHPRGPRARPSPSGGSTGTSARSSSTTPPRAHWVLAELDPRRHRASTTPTRCAPAWLEPLGLTGFALGRAAGRAGAASPTSSSCGEPADPDELEAALGIREIDVGEVTDEALLGLNVPGGPGRRAARRRWRSPPPPTSSTFYQALLHDPKGLWDPDRARPTSPPWCATRSPTR